MDTIIKKNEETEVEELRQLLKDLTPDERRFINIFIQGVRFAKQAEEKGPAA